MPSTNVVALLDATANNFNLSPADVWTLFHSSAFDFSVWEIWGCLLTGGHLIVVSHWVTRSPEDFRALLVDRCVTILNQTPSAFAALQRVDAEIVDSAPLSLRLVIFGGESLDVRILAPWFTRHPAHLCRVVRIFIEISLTIRVITDSKNTHS